MDDWNGYPDYRSCVLHGEIKRLYHSQTSSRPLRIFRGSVDTDISLADVPLVENLAEVTSLTEIEGVHQPELEFPVPTVQSNTPNLEVDRTRQNVEITDIPETTEQPSEPSAPELDVSLPTTTPPSASTSSATVSSSDYTRSQPTPRKTYPKRKKKKSSGTLQMNISIKCTVIHFKGRGDVVSYNV